MASTEVSESTILSIMSSVAADLLTEERKLQIRRPGFSIPNREYLEVLANGALNSGVGAGAGAGGGGGGGGIPVPDGARIIPQGGT